jgi:hypothetical protein
MLLTQKLSRVVEDEQTMLEKYFRILATVNSLHLAPAEIRLLAFTARKGNISTGGLKRQFCELTGFPKASLGNLISHLSKEERKWLVKLEDKIVVNPAIRIGSCSQLNLNISLYAGERLDNKENS